MGDVILGVDFQGQAEARYWERRFDMPKGSYRGWCDGVILFEDGENFTSQYTAPDKDPA